jgi:hypothetical protein
VCPFQIDLGHAFPDDAVAVCKCSFDANFADFREKTVSVNGRNLAQNLADTFGDVKAASHALDHDPCAKRVRVRR